MASHGSVSPNDAFGFLSSAAQAADDAYRVEYNTDRPHQTLDAKAPVTPAQRFAPVPAEQRELVEVWLPGMLEPVEPV